ncbi:MAG: trigger factor [Gammaproteobacteria bacterium]|nr:trigger factor [Gammaproteobacteria bacterium]
MQVSIEATGGLSRRMTVAVPAARFEEEFSGRLKRAARTARLPGFRPGRAPMKMVEVQYGGRILDEVAQDLMRDSFYEALTQQGLKMAGGPAIEPRPVVRGQDMEYVATFEIYPEVVRLDLKEVEVERPVCAITDEDVSRTVDIMRKQRVTWSPVTRAAAEGDRVTIDFVGRIDGEEFPGGAGQDHQVIVGGGRLLADFEAALRGALAGETREAVVHFPADYGVATLAGREAVFTITVKTVEEPVMPVLDEAFAESLGVTGGVDALTAEVRQNLEREAARRMRERLKGEIFRKLRELNRFDLPVSLVESEASRLRQSAVETLRAQGMATEALPADTSAFRERASERVALGIILAEVARDRQLKAEAAKVRVRIEEMAADYDEPGRFVEWYYSQPERVAEAESLVLEDEVVTLLAAEARLQDKVMRFEELT